MKHNQGFTVLELIVVMAIIAVLTMLAVLGFTSYTKEARLTQLKHDARLIRDACERYYLNHGDWPRKDDVPYTVEQIQQFAQKVYDGTGTVVTLEPDGKYYDIDFTKLQKYVTINSDPSSFVLQNPVGEVYILGSVDKNKMEEIKLANAGIGNTTPQQTAVSFNVTAGSELAFDGNLNTGVPTDKEITVTWQGNLANRQVAITMEATSYNVCAKMYDTQGNLLNFINTDNDQMVSAIVCPKLTKNTFHVIVPSNTVKLVVTGIGGILHEVSVIDEGQLPDPVTNITSASTDRSITLYFTMPGNATKAIVYEGITLIGSTTNGTITHMPVPSDSEHTYTIYAINDAGCSVSVQYTARSMESEIIFYGSSPAFFDHNLNTGAIANNATITWQGNLANRQIAITMRGDGTWNYSISASMYDDKGNKISFINADNNQMVTSVYCVSKTTFHVIVPSNAAKIVVSGGGSNVLFEVEVVDNGQLPDAVSNITSESTDCSIALHFTMPVNATRAIVYDGTTLVGITTDGTVTHTPVFADSEHTYTIYAVNNAGCSVPVQYTARSLIPDTGIIFYGSSPAFFDHDLNTGATIGTGVTITWQGNLANRQIAITMRGDGTWNYSISASMYDDKGNKISFINADNNQMVSSISCVGKTTFHVIVPSNAAKISVKSSGTNTLYEVEIIS